MRKVRLLNVLIGLRRLAKPGAHPEVKSDGQMWISKSKGLPLRDEMDVDAGDGIKHHHSTRYGYTNVQPPM